MLKLITFLFLSLGLLGRCGSPPIDNTEPLQAIARLSAVSQVGVNVVYLYRLDYDASFRQRFRQIAGAATAELQTESFKVSPHVIDLRGVESVDDLPQDITITLPCGMLKYPPSILIVTFD